MIDLRAQRRIDKLEKQLDNLRLVVANLIDAQKWHLRGNTETAAEKNMVAQRRLLKIIDE